MWSAIKRGCSVQCYWSLQCLSTRDMLQAGRGSGQHQSWAAVTFIFPRLLAKMIEKQIHTTRGVHADATHCQPAQGSKQNKTNVK